MFNLRVFDKFNNIVVVIEFSLFLLIFSPQNASTLDENEDNDFADDVDDRRYGAAMKGDGLLKQCLMSDY